MFRCHALKRFFASLFKSSKKPFEFLRFGMAGMMATLIHYGTYLLVLAVSSANIAYSIGFIISFSANFLLSNYFTFKTRPSVSKGFGFFASHGLSLALQILLLNVFLHVGVIETIAPLPVYAIVVPVNFLLVRHVLKTF